ncbi:AAA family ATPase [Fusobacterium nucleatum]|uniref:AAA family ATPase n=1 Tax=Fusobacterium nucleatum TaxID=851 RepID=UPI002360F340|nr:AAA family ATPase [Fusobacterium nucleatum]WDA46191.1 AAA family ATPase [Fusobacterium nucleatum]
MIIMNLEIDNFFCFKDFSINFSYKRKLNKSTIPYEYLEDYPNFRFKKLNILMGSNASGKTVFGKMLRAISNFIEYRNPLYLIEAVNFLDKKANFKLDFVSSNFEKKKVLSQLEVTIFKNTIERIEYNETILEKKDSYKKTLERLLNNENKVILFNKKEKVITDKMNELLEKISSLNFYFCFPDENTEEKYNLKVLEDILKTFDTSIIKVEKVKNVSNGFLVYFTHGKNLLIQNGKPAIEKDMLSSGTKEGIKIAGVISSILENKNRLFYIDEQFVHIHPEIEKTIISVIIDLIGKESQVFFTTHNLEILDMNLPIHSYIFLHRDKYITEVIYPEKILVNKNDRGLKNLAENNLFNTIPDVSLLETISEE